LTEALNVVRLVPRKDGKGERKVKTIDMFALEDVAQQNGIDFVRGNNNGQKRMNLSNMLRKMWKDGKDIHIGNTVVHAHRQTDEAVGEQVAKVLGDNSYDNNEDAEHSTQA
jgi:hypothetical protein